MRGLRHLCGQGLDILEPKGLTGHFGVARQAQVIERIVTQSHNVILPQCPEPTAAPFATRLAKPNTMRLAHCC